MMVPAGLRRLRTTGTVLVAAIAIVACADVLAIAWNVRDPRAAWPVPVMLASAAAVAPLALALYFLVMRRRDRYLVTMLEKLEERRQRFAAMFEHSSEMMAIYDVDGAIVRGNPAAVYRFGFGKEVAGTHFDVHVAPESRETTARGFAQARSGVANEFAATFLDAKGRRIPVLATLSPIVVNDRVVGVVGVARDVTAEQQYEEQLLHNRERFRVLFEQNAYAMATIKLDGTISAVNVAMERLSGYRNEEVVGKSATVFTPEGRRQLAERRLSDLSVSPEPMSYESVLLCRGGHEVPVQVDILPIRVGEHTEGYYMTVKDLTKERALSARLSEKDERVRALYNLASSASKAALQIDEALALAMRSLGMTYGFVTRVVEERFRICHRCGPEDGVMPVGFEAPSTLGIGKRLADSPRAVAIEDLDADDDAAVLREGGYAWKSLIGSRLVVEGKLYGALLFLDERAREQPFEAADADFIDLLAALVSGAVAREIADDRLERDAMRDPLTGLANRTVLEEALRRAVATAGRRRQQFAVHFIDLDRFKPINDERGHAAGDAVLQEVARRLLSATRAEDLVARVGGDEFVILQTDLGEEHNTKKLSDRVRRVLRMPVRLADNTSVQIGCSVGIAQFPDDGKTPEDLLRSADAAMYRVKEQARADVP
jgi:diguanylate cyclase (GGDEF)-like protein/PAS domain S-box-containing protein